MDRIPFSQRVGAAAAPQIGLQKMPHDLRVVLWNTFQRWIFSEHALAGQSELDAARHVFNYIGWPADESRQLWTHNLKRVKEWFFSTSWDRTYDFVEWLPYLIARGHTELPYNRDRMTLLERQYITDLDRALERAGSPYRLAGRELIPITDQVELDEVARAMQSPFAGARSQIAQAVALLSMKPEPDYRNTIKESVSAIASVLMEATGESGDFKPLLDAFEKSHAALHPAFRKAVSSYMDGPATKMEFAMESSGT